MPAGTRRPASLKRRTMAAGGRKGNERRGVFQRFGRGAVARPEMILPPYGTNNPTSRRQKMILEQMLSPANVGLCWIFQRTHRMEFTERADEWSISFTDGLIQMIQIDFRVSLLISDGKDHAWAYIEQPGHLKHGATEVEFVPSQTKTLLPILGLFNAVVKNCRIRKTGSLTIEFLNSEVLTVLPHGSWEAWQVSVSNAATETLLVCAPGGKIALFEEANVPRKPLMN